jgi:hypothetical protein
VQEVLARVDRVGDRGQVAIELASGNRVQQGPLRTRTARCRAAMGAASLDGELLAFTESGAHCAGMISHAPDRIASKSS